MKILITGGTGLVGKALVSKLREKGHFVNILVRKNPKNENEFLDYTFYSYFASLILYIFYFTKKID